MLVFVPSYHVLKATKARWEQTGAYAAIQRHKLLVFEPRSGGDEFDRAMALCGCPSLADITRDLLDASPAPDPSHQRRSPQ